MRLLPAYVYICIRLKQTFGIFEQTPGRTAVSIKLQPRYCDTKQSGVFVKTAYIPLYEKNSDVA